MYLMSPSHRLRRTPFSDGVEAEGVKAYSVYNHMLLPTFFHSVEEDSRHLREAVQVWDVACERQIELRGPDAGKLAQLLTPRDLSRMQEDQCYYIPVVDQSGGMLNDPVAVKLEEDRWWISIADSDLIMWVKGLAVGRNLDVQIFEPDVSPLAIQGPKSDELMARVFGDAVRDVKFFRYKKFELGGKEHVIARSGYSKQGGFEIYVDGWEHGMPLWNALFEAGQSLDVRAGCPNMIERVEGGLLSYGSDMTAENNPFEAGLGKFCSTDRITDCIGHAALAEVAQSGPTQQIRSISIEGDAVPLCDRHWPLRAGDQRVGRVSSAVWSPFQNTNVAIGMVAASHWDAGTELVVETQTGPRTAIVRETSWK